MIPPARMARIIIGKLGIIGCTVGAYFTYNAPEQFGTFLMFTFLAAASLLLVFHDVSKGDDNDDDDDSRPPDLRFRH